MFDGEEFECLNEAIFASVIRGDVIALREQLFEDPTALQAKMNGPNDHESSILLFSASTSTIEVVGELLNQGANIDEVIKSGTALGAHIHFNPIVTSTIGDVGLVEIHDHPFLLYVAFGERGLSPYPTVLGNGPEGLLVTLGGEGHDQRHSDHTGFVCLNCFPHGIDGHPDQQVVSLHVLVVHYVLGSVTFLVGSFLIAAVVVLNHLVLCIGADLPGIGLIAVT